MTKKLPYLSQTGFGSNFQGKLKLKNDKSLLQNSLFHLSQNQIVWQKKQDKYFYPTLTSIQFYARKRGQDSPKLAKNSTKADSAQIFRLS